MSEPEKPKRRVRYSGKNPRLFHEKYKEQQPELYAGDVEKVLASGKTPAGMHRPIMVREILEILALQPGETVVDCTLGYGGHASEMIRAIQPGGRFIGLDADPIELPKTELRLRAAFGLAGTEPLLARRMNFAGLPQLLALEAPNGVDAVLADLGVSSMQIDDPVRGFTFKFEGPLDLRMNPRRGQPASALLAKISAKDLAVLLKENSDEPSADKIAQAVIEERKRKPVGVTTTDFARFLREICPGPDASGTVQRVFQALRIAVNEEFNALDALLRHLPECLAPGGRVAILAFHSGEDRRVKHAFKAGLREGLYSAIAPDVIRVSPAELRANPRSSSAKLRWAVRSNRVISAHVE